MFDIDGTLIESYDFDSYLYVKAVREILGINNIETNWSKYRHVTDSGILNEIVYASRKTSVTDAEQQAVKERFTELVKEFVNKSPNACREVKGARKAIKKILSIQDYAIAIATGGWSTTASFKLRASGFEPDDFILASSCDHHDRTQIMKYAEQKALEANKKQEFRKITYIGDGCWDVRASKELGYDFIGIGDRVKTELKWIEDFTIFSRFEDLVRT